MLTTTNGTRLLLAAAARCETVLVASLLNLDAVVAAARASGVEDVAVLCAGVEGAFAIDDAYVAGRSPSRSAASRTTRRLRRCSSRGSSRPPKTGIGGGNQRRRTSATRASTTTSRSARGESVLDLVPRVVERPDTRSRSGAANLLR